MDCRTTPRKIWLSRNHPASLSLCPQPRPPLCRLHALLGDCVCGLRKINTTQKSSSSRFRLVPNPLMGTPRVSLATQALFRTHYFLSQRFWPTMDADTCPFTAACSTFIYKNLHRTQFRPSLTQPIHGFTSPWNNAPVSPHLMVTLPSLCSSTTFPRLPISLPRSGIPLQKRQHIF